MMSYSHSFSNSYHSSHVADDSSTVFDADTVTPDEVPSTSLTAMPPLTAIATATPANYHHNSNNGTPHSSQEESPANTISELLRRIKSRHRPAEPSTTTPTATATRSYQSSSSSSSKKRSIITNSSSLSSRKQPRRSSRLKKQQPKDQSYVDDKSDSEVEDDEPDEAVINQSSFSSQISTTKLTKREANWKSKFEELCDYKRLHGHTNVPRNNKELGQWVSKQRHYYKMFKANKKSQITKERITTLESIDFEWVSPNKGGSLRNESAWNKRFNELSAYKELHGHTNVSTHDEDNKELGIWVKTQRTEYKRFKKNGKGKITPERIEILNSIDFKWVSQNRGTPRNESAWNKRFNELVDYKELHGHTNVPQSSQDNKQLGLWVKTQRTHYKKFQENKKSQITKKRIEMLNSIGFQWEWRPASRS